MIPKPIDTQLPVTIDEAASLLLSDLPLVDRTRRSATTNEDLNLIHKAVGLQIAKDFRLWSGNDALLHACLEAADGCQEESEDLTIVIVRAMWKRLPETHVWRLVKSS